MLAPTPAVRRMTLLVVAIAACGPAGTDAADSSSSTGDPAPSCGSPSPGVDPFADPVSCDELLTLPVEPPLISVRIENLTQAAILVDNRTSGCMPPARHFDVVGEMGARAFVAPDDHCPSEWNACATRAPDWGGCLLCETLVSPIYIEPGGSFQQTWEAWVLADVDLPALCSDAGAIGCAAATPLAAGTFTAVAHAMAAPPDCACTVDALGSCPSGEPGCDVEPTLRAETEHDGVCPTLELVFSD